jgi:DNA helicase TIP49 (TBP-interacting protein)
VLLSEALLEGQWRRRAAQGIMKEMIEEDRRTGRGLLASDFIESKTGDVTQRAERSTPIGR